jgi:hypothetical protein
VITVCKKAEERCPTFPGVSQRLDWSVEDPAAFVGAEEAKLANSEKCEIRLMTRSIREFPLSDVLESSRYQTLFTEKIVNRRFHKIKIFLMCWSLVFFYIVLRGSSEVDFAVVEISGT